MKAIRFSTYGSPDVLQLQEVATPSPKDDQVLVMKDLIEAGKVVPVIDRHYPLSETAEAIRYLERGHARGKVIINVVQP